MVKMKGSATALQTCYGKAKKGRSKIRNKDQSLLCKPQMKGLLLEEISFEMHATSASEYFVSYNDLSMNSNRITGKTGKQETEMKE